MEDKKHKKSPLSRFKHNRNYGHKTLIEFIRHHSRFAQTKAQRRDMDSFIDTYLDARKLLQKEREQRDALYMKSAEGTKLDKEKVLDQFRAMDKVEDDRHRSYVVHYAKQYYRRNYSLRKSFRKTHDPTKATKDRLIS